ncbi:uncharacterized protein C2orf81 homolog isoform X2 [Denticeps clupeoides]|uniref:uncharacterized protein C2orf81 homolog isoform X2 n=1 Tax=Denticeps clupeoides TaxID=299321 RepID=UPI0010A45428|nr:uncharacterized protein C2orf81 homolog isoform X2 [Denticeps clupeoides]
MSRSATKSRGDRSRLAAAAPAPPPQPPSTREAAATFVVPGRLTEADWDAMVTQEEGEGIVAEVATELMSHVMARCFEVHLKEQLVPFLVSSTRDVLVKTVESFFLMRDEGEDPSSRLSLQEDAEPEPCSPDSWAEGCVPVLYSTRVPSHKPLLQTLLDLHLGESADSLPISASQEDLGGPANIASVNQEKTGLPGVSQDPKSGTATLNAALPQLPDLPQKKKQRKKQPTSHPHQPTSPRRPLKGPLLGVVKDNRHGRAFQNHN